MRRRLDSAAHVVETLEQRLAVGEALTETPRSIMSSRAGPSAGTGRSTVPRKPGARLVVRAVRAGVAQADERRTLRIDRALDLRHGGAELRPAAGRGRLARDGGR